MISLIQGQCFLIVKNMAYAHWVLQLEANLFLISQFPVSHSLHGSQIGKIGVSVIFHKSLDC